jgi:ABC-type uncharacterized transport system permease subunit
MFKLPLPEMILFYFVAVIYIAAAIVGILQLLAASRRYRRYLSPLISLGVALEAVILIFRAVSLKAFPLTGLFESMIVLSLLFGLVYLFFSIPMRQVWFGSVMVWVILVLVITAGIVAEPASEPLAIAATPWAIVHGITMILAVTSIMFAAASSFLYLLGRYRLKSKKLTKVIGKMPNLEKLELMTLFGIRAAFILTSIGIISGLGLVRISGRSIAAWSLDPKVVCILIAWILLGSILIMNRLLSLKSKARAYLTIAIFVLVTFAILGVAILGTTRHHFSGS